MKVKQDKTEMNIHGFSFRLFNKTYSFNWLTYKFIGVHKVYVEILFHSKLITFLIPLKIH